MTDAPFKALKALIELLVRIASDGAGPAAPNHADARVRSGRPRRIRHRYTTRRHSLDAARARLKEETKTQRRRRIAQLHPDKLGRKQTPGELAEYVTLTRKRPG